MFIPPYICLHAKLLTLWIQDGYFSDINALSPYADDEQNVYPVFNKAKFRWNLEKDLSATCVAVRNHNSYEIYISIHGADINYP